jgi:phage-related protein
MWRTSSVMSSNKKPAEPAPSGGTLRGTLGSGSLKRVPVAFYRTNMGNEPVRQWLKAMESEDKRLIGEDIKTVEFGWPVGMPTCGPLGEGLHEVRTNLPGNRTARTFFYVDKLQHMVLLHGIVKKTRTTPEADLDLARANQRRHERGIQ